MTPQELNGRLSLELGRPQQLGLWVDHIPLACRLLRGFHFLELFFSDYLEVLLILLFYYPFFLNPLVVVFLLSY